MDENVIDGHAKKIWEYMLLHHELKPCEAIFVLGSNDTRVASRAGELYREGYAPYVICAGGRGKEARFEKTEAEVFSEIITAMGVPQDRILLEPASTNTGENILFVRRLLQEKNLNFKSFLLVQKPYMERRTYATFRKQWPGMECLVTSPQISYEDYAHGDDDFKRRFIEVMVGDLQRIREYPRLGFQIEQEIPDEVWKAWEALVERGFTKYFLK